MPGLLQPRLSCFYCGCRTNYAKDGKTRQFTCLKCEATNHLDQKGEITDPPTTPARPQTQFFAHARPKTTSPTINSADSNIFCRTCLKNQAFLTNVLAGYLPSEDDPEYEKYERQYPEYRADLERRYPQICPQCAPRAQAQIQKTGYAAKVDFLNKNLHRTKAHSFSSNSSTTSLAAFALDVVKCAWWASMLLQAWWHTLRLFAIPADPEVVENMKPLMIVGCSINAATIRYLPPGCSHLFADLVRQSLKLSAMLIWWNPALKTSVLSAGFNRQWSGLSDFYRFQVVIMAVRAGAWWILTKSPIYANNDDFANVARGMHGLALLFICIGALASQRMVAYLPAPKFSFRDTTRPLVDPESFQYPSDTNETHPASRLPNPSLRPSPVRPFNIASLGSKTHTDSTRPTSPASAFNGPPTPPEDVDDSMDWEPLPRIASPLVRRTQNQNIPNSFPPRQPTAAIPSIPAFLRPATALGTAEKSPFTGRLPPAPISPAHRLRNPPARPQFKPTPLSKKQDFFKQMGLSSAALPQASSHPLEKRTRHTRGLSTDTVDDDDDDSNHNQTYMKSQKETEYFRPSQWTLQSDLEAAERGTGTGLEDLFGGSFKIGSDTPSQTPRKPREVGGDGREFVERATVQTAEAAEIVGKSLQMFAAPLVLAMLAVIVGVIRDPTGYQWVTDLFSQGLPRMKPFLVALGLQ